MSGETVDEKKRSFLFLLLPLLLKVSSKALTSISSTTPK